MNKQFTEKTAAAVLNRLLKCCQKNQPKKEAFHKAWIDAAGRQCVCDGYRAYRINARLDAVETSAEQIPMDLDKIFQPLNVGKVEEMPAPDPEAVNLAIIDGKNHSRPALYDCGPGKPAFNAEYLREILRLFPGGRWYIETAENRRCCAPAFVVHDAGSACICPVRKKQDQPAETPAAPEPSAADQSAEPAVPDPAPAPAAGADEKAPEQFLKPLLKKYTFFVYAKHPGDKNFSLADPAHGVNKLQVLYTPRFTDAEFPKLKSFLDYLSIVNPGAVYQIRTIEKRKTVYTTAPESAVFTPEDFVTLFAA